MKKITKIEYQKNNKDRINIYLDDKFEFGLDLNIMIKYGLSKNMELDDEFINEILRAEDKINAYNYAISVLSRCSKSEKQLIGKMEDKGYDNELIVITIDKLKLNKYIDDEEYSERFINNKINYSNYGKQKIKQALYNKGIDIKTINEKLKIIDDDDEFQKAYELGQKKLNNIIKEEDIKKKMKLSNFLINKGFDYEVVKKAVSKLITGDDLDNI